MWLKLDHSQLPIKMTPEETIRSEYSKLAGSRITQITPAQFKPSVLQRDYTIGYFSRCCIVKKNDQTDGYEINPAISTSVDARLYYVITFTWRVSGKKNRTVVNGIIEDYGVSEMNTNTLQQQIVSLIRFFPNPLEFWRGS